MLFRAVLVSLCALTLGLLCRSHLIPPLSELRATETPPAPTLSPPAPSKPITSLRLSRRDQEAIAEAVFRHQIAAYASRWTKARCVLLDWKGQAGEKKAFLRRFEKERLPVYSAERMTPNLFEVRERRTNQPGILLRLGAIQGLGATEAEAEGGVRRHGRAGQQATYALQKTQGQWRVVRETVRFAYATTTQGLSPEQRRAALTVQGE